MFGDAINKALAQARRCSHEERLGDFDHWQERQHQELRCQESRHVTLCQLIPLFLLALACFCPANQNHGGNTSYPSGDLSTDIVAELQQGTNDVASFFPMSHVIN
jgi:hypothetical protein